MPRTAMFGFVNIKWQIRKERDNNTCLKIFFSLLVHEMFLISQW